MNYESAAPMQSAAKCPFLLEFQTVEWGGPDDLLKAKIQRHESAAMERSGRLMQDDASPRQEEHKLNTGNRLGRSVASVTTPKRVVLEIDSDEEEEEKKSLSSASSFSSSDSENDEIRPQNGKGSKKHRKSKKSGNARRRRGAAAGSNGIGKKDQLTRFSPRKPQYSRLPSANPNPNTTAVLPAFSLSSSISSSVSSSPTNKLFTSKLGFQSRAGDYAYNSAKGDRGDDNEKEDDYKNTGDENEDDDDEEEEEEDPLAFQQQRAATESLAGQTHGAKDHNGLLAILSSGLKDKSSGRKHKYLYMRIHIIVCAPFRYVLIR